MRDVLDVLPDISLNSTAGQRNGNCAQLYGTVEPFEGLLLSHFQKHYGGPRASYWAHRRHALSLFKAVEIHLGCQGNSLFSDKSIGAQLCMPHRA